MIAELRKKEWYKASNELPPYPLPPYDPKRYAVLGSIYFYDPIPALARLNCPLLAVFGEEDRNSPAKVNVAILERLRNEDHRDIRIRVFPNAGHSLLTWRQFPPGYVHGYLELIADWAREKVAHRQQGFLQDEVRFEHSKKPWA